MSINNPKFSVGEYVAIVMTPLSDGTTTLSALNTPRARILGREFIASHATPGYFYVTDVHPQTLLSEDSIHICKYDCNAVVSWDNGGEDYTVVWRPADIDE